MTEREPVAAGQVSGSAAEVYDEFFVPALFAQWAPVVLDAAGARPGDRILDAGCGTGVLAREAARRLGGPVTAIDVNEAMLAVARRHPEQVTWRLAAMEELPFEDASFDRALSQFALMFVTDRRRAVGELARVTARGGSVAVATWAAVEHSPGYAAIGEMLERVVGREGAESLGTPFSMGSPAVLEELLGSVAADVEVRQVPGRARFPSLEGWLHTEIHGWTLADSVDAATFDRLFVEARSALERFVTPDGRVEFDVPAIVGVARIDR